MPPTPRMEDLSASRLQLLPGAGPHSRSAPAGPAGRPSPRRPPGEARPARPHRARVPDPGRPGPAQTFASHRARGRIRRRRRGLHRRDDREHRVPGHRAFLPWHLDLDAVVGAERLQRRIRRVSGGGRGDRGPARAPARLRLRPGGVHRRLAAVRHRAVGVGFDCLPGCAGARRGFPRAVRACGGTARIPGRAPLPRRCPPGRGGRGRSRPGPLARRTACRRRELALGVHGERSDRCGGGVAGSSAAGREPDTRPPSHSRPARHAAVRRRDRDAGAQCGQGPGMGLGQCTDHRLSRDGAGARRGGHLALYPSPLAGSRPDPAEDPDVRCRQRDDGHRGGWLLRLHAGERLVPHRRPAVLGPAGWPGPHRRPAGGGGGGRAGQPAGAELRPPPGSGRRRPAVGRGGAVVRRTSRDDARLRGPVAARYGAARDRRRHAVPQPQRYRGRLRAGRELRDGDWDQFCRPPGRSRARRRDCRSDHRDADAGDSLRGISPCLDVRCGLPVRRGAWLPACRARQGGPGTGARECRARRCCTG